jgi:hypothetical protein
MTQMMTKVDPQLIWKGFHWLFIVDIQGLIICLRRFEINLASDDLHQAQVELETATDLMLASGAAMELAGSFSKQEYQKLVRPTMSPPHVQSNDFSGLMSWEHASLMEIWKRLCPAFKTLPVALHPQHDRFIDAYLSLAISHRAVCDKFGGSEGGSLRCDRTTAVTTLDKFTHNRLQLIDPNHRVAGGCPFHRSQV